MRALQRRIDGGDGTVTRAELSAFSVDGEPLRLIDTSKGIWNPKSMEATLSVLSSPTGPYADVEIAPGVWRYAYRAGSTAGDNTKLRRAFELKLPIIMLRKIHAWCLRADLPGLRGRR